MDATLSSPPVAVREREDRLKTLTLAHPTLWRDIDRAVAGLDLAIEYVPECGLFITRLEAQEPDVVLFDVDAACGNADLVVFARSLWPPLPIFALVHPWSERADMLRDLVDGLLHKPPRREQWAAVLAKRWRATT